MKSPYGDVDLIKEATNELLRTNHTVFQSHLFGGTEDKHCDFIRKLLAVPSGAKVLDIGCGVGGVASRLTDLDVTLLNINHYQLSLSKGQRVQGDANVLPFKAGTFDVAMLLYVLGHCNRDETIAEAKRVAKSLLIVDIIADDVDWWETCLNYRPFKQGDHLDWEWAVQVTWKDGGLFEDMFPGAWERTGAQTLIMRTNSDTIT